MREPKVEREPEVDGELGASSNACIYPVMLGAHKKHRHREIHAMLLAGLDCTKVAGRERLCVV